MISYETYKTLHLIFILTFFSSLGFAINTTTFLHQRLGKIILGIISFLIFVAGMGLIARLNFKHSEAFPLWIKMKIFIWLLVNILFFILLKIKKNMTVILSSMLILAIIAIWVATNKPL